MPVFKNEDNGTWYVMARYVNWKGERKQKCKRGFVTKKEAQEWERMFQLQNASDLDMSFEAFTELYIRDVKTRLKENTWLTKEHIIRTKILPYFGKLRISEISTKEIITWQNELLAYRDEKKQPYLIMRYVIMNCVPILPQRWEIWEVRNTRKCCSGQKKNTRSSLLR